VTKQKITSGKWIAIFSLVVLATLLVSLHLRGLIGGVELYSTSSPDGQYKVEINQVRGFPLLDRHVHLTARRNGTTIVNRELLYTGDFLDGDFRELYPNPMWPSNSALELGYDDAKPEVRSSELKITNQTSNTLEYVLIESSLRKLLLLEVKPGATVYQRFQVRASLYCEGRYSGTNKRFGGAVSIPGNRAKDLADYDTESRFSIRINRAGAVIASPEMPLQAIRCCAPDRPDYEHE